MADGLFTIRTAANEADENKQDGYKGRLLKLIPGETVSLYAIASGLIMNNVAENDRYPWFQVVFFGCLGLTLLIRFVEARDPNTKKPQWGNIAASCVSFVIYAYTLGGLFQYHPRMVWGGWQQFLGTIVSGFWTVALPYIAQAAALLRKPPAG